MVVVLLLNDTKERLDIPCVASSGRRRRPDVAATFPTLLLNPCRRLEVAATISILGPRRPEVALRLDGGRGNGLWGDVDSQGETQEILTVCHLHGNRYTASV